MSISKETAFERLFSRVLRRVVVEMIPVHLQVKLISWIPTLTVVQIGIFISFMFYTFQDRNLFHTIYNCFDSQNIYKSILES